MYSYEATVTRVVDGDTVHLDIDTGFGIHFNTIVRLSHINCPEMSTSAGKVARQYAVDWLIRNAPNLTDATDAPFCVMVVTQKDKADKYGRYLAEIYANGKSLNQDLVSSGNAVPYEGGAR